MGCRSSKIIEARPQIVETLVEKSALAGVPTSESQQLEEFKNANVDSPAVRGRKKSKSEYIKTINNLLAPPSDNDFDSIFEPPSYDCMPQVEKELLEETKVSTLQKSVNSLQQALGTTQYDLDKIPIALIMLLIIDANGEIEKLSLEFIDKFPFLQFQDIEFTHYKDIVEQWKTTVGVVLHYINKKELKRSTSFPAKKQPEYEFADKKRFANQVSEAFLKASAYAKQEDKLKSMQELALSISQNRLRDPRLLSELYWRQVFTNNSNQ